MNQDESVKLRKIDKNLKEIVLNKYQTRNYIKYPGLLN